MFRAPRVEKIADQRRRADSDDERDDGDRREAASEDGEAEDDAGQAHAREHRASRVERTDAFLAQIGDEARRQRDAQKTDGHIDPENIAPVEMRREKAAERRADQRADERRHGEPRHGAHEFVTRRGAQQHEPPDRHHHRAAQTLNDAREHDLEQRMREARQDRADGEDGDGGAKHAPRAEFIRRPAGERDEDGERQQIGGEREFERHRVFMQIRRHGGEGGGEHGAVELLHEQGGRDDQRRDDVGGSAPRYGCERRQISFSPRKLVWPLRPTIR